MASTRPLKLLLFPALLAASGIASEPETDVFSDWVLSESTAYGMLKPEAVAAGHAEQILWSGDNQHLLILRTDRKPENRVLNFPPETESTTISEWNRLTGKTKDLIKVALSPSEIIVEPILKSSSVVVSSQNGTTLLDTSSGRSNSLQVPLEPGEFARVEPSPLGGRFVINGFSGFVARPEGIANSRTEVIRVYDLSGALVASGEVPVGLIGPDWSKDGWPVFRTRRTKENPVSQEAVCVRPGGVIKWDPSAVVTEYPEPNNEVEARGEPQKLGESSIESGWLQLTEEASKKTKDVDARDSLRRAMIGVDIKGWPCLNDSIDAVAYISRGVPMVRRIVKMPKDEFLKALKAAKKNRAISYAKQAATAALIYSMDADDSLPLGNNFADAIGPYLKNPSIAHMFTYTFGGGPLPSDANPATFQIGFVQEGDGRAVAYADGHVKWIPNP